MKRAAASLVIVGLVVACGEAAPPPPNPKSAADSVKLSPLQLHPEEKHLADIKQLTLAGENAEAYWSFDGTQLIMQSRAGDNDCDRIHRLPLSTVLPIQSGPPPVPPVPIPVSSGKGATTCSYFLPG